LASDGADSAGVSLPCDLVIDLRADGRKKHSGSPLPETSIVQVIVSALCFLLPPASSLDGERPWTTASLSHLAARAPTVPQRGSLFAHTPQRPWSCLLMTPLSTQAPHKLNAYEHSIRSPPLAHPLRDVEHLLACHLKPIVQCSCAEANEDKERIFAHRAVMDRMMPLIPVRWCLAVQTSVRLTCSLERIGGR
jgi:hypothetical protein